MKIAIAKSQAKPETQLAITGSKSETNRLLLLHAFYPQLSIVNVSASDDSEAMQHALASTSDVIDIHHAGTAMRFLTAYFALQQGRTVTLTGSERMQQRPIGILVDALRELGADIEYVNEIGYPPVKIVGKKLTFSKVTLEAGVSSQFISALLLIAPKLENGLELTLSGTITSVPYIKMTLALLAEIGIDASFEDNRITVKPAVSELQPLNVVVESDWSSASYFYSMVALSDLGTAIELSSYKSDSLQGDRALVEFYRSFGVETFFSENTIRIVKTQSHKPSVVFDLNHTPDIAQTIAVTCFGLGMSCELLGLHTLKIKETDRLEALRKELSKFGADISITDDSLSLKPSAFIHANVAVDTYNDHRMAMAFAPLGLCTSLVINDAGVVTKSFPSFWEDMLQVGLEVKILK